MNTAISDPPPPSTQPRKLSKPALWALVLTGILIVALIIATEAVMLIVTGLIAGTVLRGLSNIVQRRTRLGKGLSLFAVLMILTGGLVVIGWSSAEQIAAQFDALTQSMPKVLERATTWMQKYQWSRQLMTQAEDSISLSGEGGRILRVAGGYFSSTFGAVANAFIVLILAIYFASETQTYQSGFVRLFSHPWRPRMEQVTTASAAAIRDWVRGQLVSMLFLGTATYIGLRLLDVPLALILSVIAGLLNIIPYVGPIIAAVPIALVALSVSPLTALYALILAFGLQTIEGNFIMPMVQQRVSDMPPVLLLSAQLLLGSLFGFFGVLLAAPLTAVGMVAIRMLYVEDVLGDRA